MKKLITLSFLGLFALAAGVAQAQLGNPGFEVPVGTDNDGNWQAFSGNGSSNQATIMPHSGTGHMDLQTAGANGFAGVFQTLRDLSSVAVPKTPIAINPGDTVTFSGWHKSLVDPFNGTREVKIEWTGAPQLRVDSLLIGTEYEQFSLTGIAPPGTTGVTLTYAISSFNPGAGENNVYLDDMAVTIQRIPEPTSIALLGLAAFGLTGIRRRSK